MNAMKTTDCKIVSFTLHLDGLEAMVARCDADNSLRDFAERFESVGDGFESPPMFITDASAITARKLLAGLPGIDGATEKDLTKDYAFYTTNAPKAYDMGQTLDGGDTSLDGDTFDEGTRLIAIERDAIKTQVRRYDSGNKICMPCDF
jgi:hypothetical protein